MSFTDGYASIELLLNFIDKKRKSELYCNNKDVQGILIELGRFIYAQEDWPSRRFAEQHSDYEDPSNGGT